MGGCCLLLLGLLHNTKLSGVTHMSDAIHNGGVQGAVDPFPGDAAITCMYACMHAC
jgi:hypothetical protein